MLWGQSRTITGTVTDVNDVPLSGVNIVVEGTLNGTQTDFDGAYAINASEGQILSFSYLGFKTETREIGDSNVINLQLEEDAQALDEVVVVGFGETSKARLTDNVASISSEQINEIPIPSLQSTLVGKAAGVQITQVNGKAESGIKVRVRGVSTITGSQEPLYVVDGIPIINSEESVNDSPINPLVGLNPDDIESIQILKDASSAAIYGARGTNGVVLITTKKGKQGRTTVSLRSSYGVSKATNKREWLNTDEYVELFTEAGLNSGFTEGEMADYFNIFAESEEDWSEGLVDTDWQDLALVEGDVQDLGVSVSGGNEKTRFFISTGYNKTNGIIRGNRLERYSLRANIDHNVSDRFKIGVNSTVSKTQISRLSNDNAFATPLQAVAQIPFTRPYADDGITPNNGALYYNFLFQEFNADHDTNIWRSILNLFGEYQITDNLKFRTEVGYDLNHQVEERFFGSLTESASTNGFADTNAVQNEKYVLNNYFTYDHVFGNVDLNFVGGMSFEQDNRSLQFVEGQDFPSDALQTLNSAGEIVGGGSSRTFFNFLSYFARANTTILGKYLLKASVRVDGSSRFGQDKRYGTFPAFSGGWIVSEENFLKGNETLSNLKLRASWGLTGNAEIGNFESRTLLGSRTYNQSPGLSISQLGDPELSWEETTQTNFGIDFGFLRNRITASIDYYTKITDGILLDVPVPSTSGVQTVVRNSGELENKGLEFVLDTKNFVKDNFTWSTSFNIATNDNKVTSLPGGNDIISGQNIAREGEPIASFYLVEYAGVDPENGDALFYRNTELADGSRDRSTTNNFGEASRIIAGNPFPEIIAGVTNNFTLGNFDASFTFQGQWGASIYNGGGRFQSASADFFDNQSKDQLQRWQQPGDITNVPQLRLFGGNGTQTSTRYLDEADFIRLRNLTVGYSFPNQITEKLNISRLRLYFTGVNLLTFTDYNSWDPEATADFNANNSLAAGIEFYSAPPAKTITFGFNIDF
ncbi:MAG: TonB-dependent receptor [Allomuricauda sp.]